MHSLHLSGSDKSRHELANRLENLRRRIVETVTTASAPATSADGGQADAEEQGCGTA